MDLVVGATGLLGSEICRLLCKEGRDVCGLIRSTSQENIIKHLKSYGVNLIEGDLKDSATIENACKNVKTVISTASSTLSRQEGDSIQTVDLNGQLNLVKTAKKAGVENFVFISFRDNPELQYPLSVAKRKVEKEIISSGMNYTIIQASWFMEIWLSEKLGFDIKNYKANIFGDGIHKISWISYKDVAKFAEIALIHPEAKNKIIEIGGREGLSPLEVIAIFEKYSAKHFEINFVSEADLMNQKEEAKDELQESFAGLMLQYAKGDHIDMRNTLRIFPLEMTTVENYAENLIQSLKEHSI